MLRLKRIATLALCLTGLVGLRPAEGADFAQQVPDNAYAFFSINDASAFGEGFSKSSMGRCWADPEMQAFVGPAIEKFKADFEQSALEQEAAGHPTFDMETFKALFPGQTALWLEPVAGDPYDSVAIMLRGQRAEAVERYQVFIDDMLNSLEQEFTLTKSSRDVNGNAIYIAEWDPNEHFVAGDPALGEPTTPEPSPFDRPSIAYSFPKGEFIMAFNGIDAITNAIGAGTSAPLSEHIGYKAIESDPVTPQLKMFINSQNMVGMAINWLRQMNPQVDQMVNINYLGLQDVLDLSYRLEIAEDALLAESRIRTVPNPTGLTKALMSFQPLNPEMARAIPTDVLSCTLVGYDSPQAISQLLATLRMASPQATMFLGMMQGNFEGQLGMSIENEILPAFGDQIGIYTSEQANDTQIAAGDDPTLYAVDQPDTTMIFTLNNRDVVDRMIGTINTTLSPGAMTAAEPFQGTDIYTMAGGAPGIMTPAIAINDSHFIFSTNIEQIRGTLLRMNGKDSNNLFDAGLELPEGKAGETLTSYARNDLASQLEMAFNQLTVFAMSEGLQLGPIPSAQTLRHYIGIVEDCSYITPEGIVAYGNIPNEPK